VKDLEQKGRFWGSNANFSAEIEWAGKNQSEGRSLDSDTSISTYFIWVCEKSHSKFEHFSEAVLRRAELCRLFPQFGIF
jgi:hypothetical protein